MMNEFLEQANEKIAREAGAYKGDRYGEAMKKEVASALLRLCGENGEFAQAVAQGGDFAGCMAAVCKKVKGGSLSDLDAYCAAAGYFFPGCTVRMNLEINLCGALDEDGFVGTKEHLPAGDGGQRAVVINLMDLL